MLAQSLEVTAMLRARAPRSGLSTQFKCSVDWDRANPEELTFVYFTHGHQRDVFVSGPSESAKPYVLKAHRLESGAANPNRDEWNAYLQLHTIRRCLPVVYGYFEVNTLQGDVAVLLVERIGFTFAEFLEKSRVDAPTHASLSLVREAILRTYKAMREGAESGLLPLAWHVCNIGFTDDRLASRVVLMDWQNTHIPSATTPKERCEKAFKCFCRYLPGPHTYGPDDVSTKTGIERDNIIQWREVLTRMTHALMQWWSTNVTETGPMPSGDYSGELGSSLRQIIENPVDVPEPTPKRSRQWLSVLT